MAQPVVHWEIIAKDAKKLHEFYSELFDWKIDANNPMDYGLVEASEGGIGGGIGPGEPTWGVTFYVQVPDPQAYLDKIESLGGKTINPPTDVPGGPTVAQFADPEGHIIGLVKEE